MSALTGLALPMDYLPDIERLYQQDGDRSLVYSLAEFTPVLLQTLPALQMPGIQLMLPKGLRNLTYPQPSLSLSGNDSGKPVSYLLPTGLNARLRLYQQRELGLNIPFLHGGLSRKKRDELVDKFQNDFRTQGMILSLKHL